MGIRYVEGNIISALQAGDIDIFAHGVNCMGGFGSGLAAQIAKTMPEVRTKYLQKHEFEGWGLGQTQLVTQNIVDPKSNVAPALRRVLNCATQKSYGRKPLSMPHGMYCNYGAIHEAMYEYHGMCRDANWIPGLPLIGCGLAGGDWNVVEKIIENIFDDMTVIVYKYKE